MEIVQFSPQHPNYRFDYRNHDTSQIVDFLKNLVTRAESLDFDSFWVMDHFHHIPFVGKFNEMLEKSQKKIFGQKRLRVVDNNMIKVNEFFDNLHLRNNTRIIMESSSMWYSTFIKRHSMIHCQNKLLIRQLRKSYLLCHP